MTRLARVAIAVLLSAACLLAQAIDPPVRRILQPWPAGPTFHTGPMRDVAVGTFVPPGRGIVALRGSDLFLFQEPVVFDHCAPAGSLGLRSIDVVRGFDGAADRLAAVSPQGLHVLAFQAANGFVTVGGNGTWSNVDEISTGVFDNGGVQTNYVLGRTSGAVALAIINTNATVTPVMLWTAPGAAGVVDACLVDWDGGPPEVGVQLMAGFTLLASNGTSLRTVAGNVIAGRITGWNGSSPGVTRVLQAQAGTAWTVDTVFQNAVTAGGTLVMPQPLVGIAAVKVNGDSLDDLVVSSQDSVRRVLVGASHGPQTAPGYVVEVHDENPLPVGTNLAPAVVADVTDDGNLDLVFGEEAADKVGIFPSLRVQLMTLAFGHYAQEGDTSVGWVKALGHDGNLNAASIVGWTQGEGALGIRLLLPDNLPPILAGYDHLLVTSYPIQDPASGAMTENDPVVLTPTHWTFPVSPPSHAAATVDILLPFTQPDPAAIQRYWLEIRLVDQTDGGFVNGNAPLCLGLAFKWTGDQCFRDVVETMTMEQEQGGWFDVCPFEWSVMQSTMIAGAQGPCPGSEPDGNRFVGIIDVPPPHKKKKTLNGLPVPSTVVPLNASAPH